MDCLNKYFIPTNKDILKNAKDILVYDSGFYNAGDGSLILNSEYDCGIFTLMYFNKLLYKHFNNLNFIYCDNINKLKENKDKYDIIFINMPFKMSDELKNIIDEINNNNNKRLYKFYIQQSFYDDIKALIENINIDYKNYNKDEVLHCFIPLANRQDYLEYKKEYANTHKINFYHCDFNTLEEYDDYMNNIYYERLKNNYYDNIKDKDNDNDNNKDNNEINKLNELKLLNKTLKEIQNLIFDIKLKI